ncbi:gamma-aminobutyric acid type B receptor subunit 2-like [Tubulanus polymorphus]|uniref:gamma-aminobutyric acid type B receptor subunit 2-like n=1 Tax=Tubulanus polymorphus TaxID=672921 RepID=UPI003DA4E5E3
MTALTVGGLSNGGQLFALTVSVLVALVRSVQDPPQPTEFSRTGNKTDLYIAGFFPLGENQTEGALGRGVLPAAKLAMKHVNEDDSILPEYRLRMKWNDTKCQMAIGTKAFFDMMHFDPPKVILFGPSCKSVTGPIAEMTKWWDIWQLSFADMNPELSDRKKYPNLFRSVPSDNDFNPARIAILKRFKWRKVATLYQDASKGASRFAYTNNALTKMLFDQGFNVTIKSFSDDPSSALKVFKDNDIRIILGSFSEIMARRVFCQAYHMGLYGEKHVWIVLGFWQNNWWMEPDASINCHPNQIKQTIDGSLATDIISLSSSNEKTVAKMTSAQYLSEYDKLRKREYSRFHGYAYDGIWVIAKALDNIVRAKHGQPITVDDVRSEAIHTALNDTDFRGVTGQVQFSNGERVGEIAVLQYQDGRLVQIGEFYAINNSLSMNQSTVRWVGGKGPPPDRLDAVVVLQQIYLPIYVCLAIIATIGIVASATLMIINVIYRKHRYIKMSSPKMNNLIIIGSILCYTSVLLLGADNLVEPVAFPFLCAARSWVLSLGFTFAFGAMFSKTWRVHAIFTNIKMNKKVIKDYKLLIIVLFLVLLDVGLLSTWQIVDPLKRCTKKHSPIMLPNSEVAIIPLFEYCFSEYMTIWMGIIYAYKGLLLIFGCFLAWETRQVSIPALNDSKYIGMSVYNVVIMCVSGAAISFIIKDQLNAAFIIISLFIIFCTTITLCLVFVPKLIQLRKDPKGEERRIRATLKKISKRDSNHSNDIGQKIKRVSEENMQLAKILADKERELEELLVQVGDVPPDETIPDGISSPVHKTVASLRLNNSPYNNYRYAPGYTDDTDSVYSSTSVTHLWTADNTGSSKLYIRERTESIDTRNTDTIEMSEIGKRSPIVLTPIVDQNGAGNDTVKRYSRVYFDLENSDEDVVLENIPLNETNRIPQKVIANNTKPLPPPPPYPGLKHIAAEMNSHVEPVDSDAEKSDTGSVHSLPGSARVAPRQDPEPIIVNREFVPTGRKCSTPHRNKSENSARRTCAPRPDTSRQSSEEREILLVDRLPVKQVRFDTNSKPVREKIQSPLVCDIVEYI